MSIQAILVVTSRNSKLDKTYLVGAGKELKEAISNEFQLCKDKFLNDKNSITEYSENALINDEKYYFSLNSNEYDFLNDIYEIINSDWNDHKILKLVNSKRETLEEKDNFRILIVKDDKYMYFAFLTSKFLIRKKTIFDFSFKDSKSSLKSTNIGYVENGIMLPSEFNSVYDIEGKKLFVINPDSFEKMVYIYEKNKKLAETNFEAFKKSKYRISSEEYSVKFENADEIKTKILASSRNSSRLAKYDQSQQFGINRIKLAVNKLKKDQKINFDDENRIIYVNEKNYKTFVAVIHNSIVERLISGDVEVLN